MSYIIVPHWTGLSISMDGVISRPLSGLVMGLTDMRSSLSRSVCVCVCVCASVFNSHLHPFNLNTPWISGFIEQQLQIKVNNLPLPTGMEQPIVVHSQGYRDSD